MTIPMQFFTLQMWDLGFSYEDISLIHGLGPFLVFMLNPVIGKFLPIFKYLTLLYFFTLFSLTNRV